MNNYVIATNDKITIDKEINKLNNNKECEVVYYDLIETEISRLIEDLDTYNLFSTRKIIVGYNAFFLGSEKVKSTIEHNLEELEHYLDNPSENILVLISENIDKRKKITTSILKKCTLIEEDNDIDSLIKNNLEDYKMDNNAIKLLIEYSTYQDKNYKMVIDKEKILNELDKLKLYKLDDKVIKSSDIEEIVTKRYDENISRLLDAILSNNKKYAFTLYNNFILHGEQVIYIMISLATKIRLIEQVKILIEDGKNTKEISELLKVHEYPIKLAKEAGYKYNEKTLLDLLDKLSKLDLEIKSGETNGEVEFETLLASI